MFEKGLFVFRRDLRLFDNVGLNQAWKQCNKLYVCFIFHARTSNKQRV